MIHTGHDEVPQYETCRQCKEAAKGETFQARQAAGITTLVLTYRAIGKSPSGKVSLSSRLRVSKLPPGESLRAGTWETRGYTVGRCPVDVIERGGEGLVAVIEEAQGEGANNTIDINRNNQNQHQPTADISTPNTNTNSNTTSRTQTPNTTSRLQTPATPHGHKHQQQYEGQTYSRFSSNVYIYKNR